MTDAAAYRALISARLADKSDAFAAVLSDVAMLRLDADATLYFEVHVAEMTNSFPVAIFLDGPVGTPQLAQETCAALDGIGKLLSRDEEDRFAVFEVGPMGPQHAITQPIIDGVAAEQTIILPWVIAHAKQAGLQAIGCEVVASLHDSADPQIIVPRPQPTPTSPPKPASLLAALLRRKPKGKS